MSRYVKVEVLGTIFVCIVDGDVIRHLSGQGMKRQLLEEQGAVFTPLVELTEARQEALGDIATWADECLGDEEIQTWLHPARLGVLRGRIEVLNEMLAEAEGGSGDS